MPELPEVETIRNDLAPALVGHHVNGVTIIDPKAIRSPSPTLFKKCLAGRTILGIRRRGKYLIFQLSSPSPAGCSSGSSQPKLDKDLLVHLKMSGTLLLNPSSTNRHARVRLEMDDGGVLLFADPRRFGRMWLADAETVVGALGPEPLTSAFTPDVFASRLRGRKTPIKALLLDQHFLAGVGNMYADEALFAARLHPLRVAGELTPTETRRLHKAIQEVLRAGIKAKGASTSDYIRPDGKPGAAHDTFNVAHRRRANCRVCGTPIERIVVRGRGTYLCPKCQKASS